MEIGSVLKGHRDETFSVRGRNVVDGLPKTITMTSDETEEAMHDTMQAMISAAKDLLSTTPPELASDIIDRGIVITGGGALLDGIDMLFSEHLKVPVMISETPLDDVALGTGKLLDHIENQINKGIIFLIRCYQKYISPMFPPTCRYYPTCS